MTDQPNRTSAGLRDILFDEIDALRKPKGNPQRAMAVSALAKQIISTVDAETRFRQAMAAANGVTSEYRLGSLQLGSNSDPQPAASAAGRATAA